MYLSLLVKILAVCSFASGSPVDTESSIVKRYPSNVRVAGNPVPIDPTGAFTRAAWSIDNTIFAGYNARNGSVDILRFAHSADRGASWQYRGEVFRGDLDKHDIDNPMVLQLANGRILYAYRNHDRPARNAYYTWMRISISYSDDGGATFKYLSTVAEKPPAKDASGKPIASGLWEPYIRLSSDGTIQCYYSEENSPDDQNGWMKYSKDGGKTWSGRVPVSGQNALSRDGMMGVAPIGAFDKDLIAVFENTEIGKFNIDYVLSHDGGYTWGQRTRLYTPPTGHAGAPQIYNVWGTLVCSFMTSEATPSAGPFYENGEMRVITSGDNGKTWSRSVVTGPAPAAWPGLFNVDPSHFLAFYSQSGKGAFSQRYELY